MVFKNLINGKTLFRITQTNLLERISLSGDTLDLAGGSEPSYRAALTKDKKIIWDVADYQDIPGIKYSFDANKPWPIESEHYDNVLILNSIYIFESPDFILREARRILKKEGQIIIAAPFLWPERPEPVDYRRYTLSGLTTLLLQAGFKVIWVKSHGGIFSVSIEILRPIFRKFYIYPPLAFFCQILDALVERYGSYISGYYFGSIAIAKNEKKE